MTKSTMRFVPIISFSPPFAYLIRNVHFDLLFVFSCECWVEKFVVSSRRPAWVSWLKKPRANIISHNKHTLGTCSFCADIVIWVHWLVSSQRRKRRKLILQMATSSETLCNESRPRHLECHCISPWIRNPLVTHYFGWPVYKVIPLGGL